MPFFRWNILLSHKNIGKRDFPFDLCQILTHAHILYDHNNGGKLRYKQWVCPQKNVIFGLNRVLLYLHNLYKICLWTLNPSTLGIVSCKSFKHSIVQFVRIKYVRWRYMILELHFPSFWNKYKLNFLVLQAEADVSNFNLHTKWMVSPCLVSGTWWT